MKTAQIWLDYYKQGDDFAHAIEFSDNAVEAFNTHAAQMRSVSEVLEQIAEIVKKYTNNEVETDGDTYLISITGPDEMIDELIKHGLANEVDKDDENYEDDE